MIRKKAMSLFALIGFPLYLISKIDDRLAPIGQGFVGYFSGMIVFALMVLFERRHRQKKVSEE